MVAAASAWSASDNTLEKLQYSGIVAIYTYLYNCIYMHIYIYIQSFDQAFKKPSSTQPTIEFTWNNRPRSSTGDKCE